MGKNMKFLESKYVQSLKAFPLMIMTKYCLTLKIRTIFEMSVDVVFGVELSVDCLKKWSK